MSRKVWRSPFKLTLVVCLLAAKTAWAQSTTQNTRSFLEVFRSRLSEVNHLTPRPAEPVEVQIQRICPFDSNAAVRLVLYAYGAVFVGSDKVHVPDRCVFRDEEDVKRFQASIRTSSVLMGDATIVLQVDAMEALLKAQAMARAKRLRITPLDGAIAGGRSYGDTLALWHSRFDPAIRVWTANGRITNAEAERVKAMGIFDVIEQVREWESQGMLFGTGQRSSIFSSVAPPGTSQHLSMLAFDVVEYDDRRVRSILEKNGWFQTIRADAPHFTYLGLSRNELPARGLQQVVYSGRSFWVPAREPRVR